QRVAVVELTTRREDDLVAVATLAHVEDGVFGELLRDTNAARAHDAALGVVHDGRPETHALRLVNRLGVLALRGVLVLVVVVLELALAGLVADGAVDWMVQEEELLYGRLRLLDALARAGDLHALGGRHLAGRLELGLGVRNEFVLGRVELEDRHHHRAAARDLHEAHAAVRRDREARMPAIMGDLDPLAPGRPDDGVTGLEGYVLTVELEAGHESLVYSAVALAADHVDRAERRNDVCDHVADDHLPNGLKVVPARGADTHPIGCAAPVRYDVEAELAVAGLGERVDLALGRLVAFHHELEVRDGAFDGRVDLGLRRQDDARVVDGDGARVGHLLDGLLEDAQALPNLLEATHEAIP